MSGERDYRGTVRTLSVLRALNERDGMSVIELSARTDISRAALYRILAVLERNGYITRAEENGSIFLTNLIQTLSAGYQDEARIREAGGKVLDELQKQIKWPTDLGILQNFRIKLLMTTRSHSPLVIDRGFAGIDMPIAYTALGQAYIAFCTPSERKAIIEHLAGDENAVDCEMFRNKARTNGLLKGVRSQGFGSRNRQSYDEKRYPGTLSETAAIAVPIFRGRYAVASLGMTFIASALSVKDAANKHLADLEMAARLIGAQMDREVASR